MYTYIHNVFSRLFFYFFFYQWYPTPYKNYVVGARRCAKNNKNSTTEKNLITIFVISSDTRSNIIFFFCHNPLSSKIASLTVGATIESSFATGFVAKLSSFFFFTIFYRFQCIFWNEIIRDDPKPFSYWLCAPTFHEMILFQEFKNCT